MTIREKRMVLDAYCQNETMCNVCLLCDTELCDYRNDSSLIEPAYSCLVGAGEIVELTDEPNTQFGIQFDFGWIKGDFPLEGDSDDLLDRLKIVSQIIAAEAESLKRFVDDLE